MLVWNDVISFLLTINIQINNWRCTFDTSVRFCNHRIKERKTWILRRHGLLPPIPSKCTFQHIWKKTRTAWRLVADFFWMYVFSSYFIAFKLYMGYFIYLFIHIYNTKNIIHLNSDSVHCTNNYTWIHPLMWVKKIFVASTYHFRRTYELV